MITINIRSEGTREGKTSVAVIIAKALAEAGITGAILSEDTYLSLADKYATHPVRLAAQAGDPEVLIYDGENTKKIEDLGGSFGF